ncbi:MAG: SAM-dependent methyltransferase [Actinophytocola sp.]|uniref:SAM-dependent methyltransferase n=1 Tax=Actinophytocola sp. TaxID=1872138 RepID=UPI003C73234B
MDKPALSRVYNGAAGGASTAAVDRSLLERVFALMPGYRYFAMANLRFASQAVTSFVDAGVTQVLDLGCGMLTPQSSHHVAHAKNPDVRVAYIDIDPVTVAHVSSGTEGDERIAVVRADVADADAVLDDPAVRAVLDLDRPVGVLAAAVLHCLPDDGPIPPADTVRRYHERLAPGSLLAASHASGDTLDPEMVAEAVSLFQQAGITVLSRSADEFSALLGPWRLRPPGLSPLRWTPESGDEVDALAYTVIAEK